MKISSYSSIYALGHRAVTDLTNGEVIVEEKIDGSQFSMTTVGGELSLRSKGSVLYVDAPESMFAKAILTASMLKDKLNPGWIYRCEYLSKPKHNSLAYSRIPAHHLIIFDIDTGIETYLQPEQKAAEASRLGLECVPMLYRGVIDGIDAFHELLKTPSILGGQTVEGVVVKPSRYDLFGLDKKVIMGKFVSEAFKEIHAKEWPKSNPSTKDVVQQLIDSLATPARWEKAVQHLRERGEIEDSPRDIGKLIAEVPADIAKEETGAIKEALFAWAWPQIRRGVTRGLAEYYKERLLNKQFET